MSKLFATLSLLFLMGCQSAPISSAALIPIAAKPESPGVIERPYLPIMDISEQAIESCEQTGALCGDLIKALDASLAATWAWGKQQEKVLDGYREEK